MSHVVIKMDMIRLRRYHLDRRENRIAPFWTNYCIFVHKEIDIKEKAINDYITDHLWKEYRATLDGVDVVFEREQDAAIFLLRWS